MLFTSNCILLELTLLDGFSSLTQRASFSWSRSFDRWFFDRRERDEVSDPSASLIHLLEGALARSSQRPGEVRAASESSPSQQAVRLMRRSVGAVRMLWVRALSRLWTAVAEEA